MATTVILVMATLMTTVVAMTMAILLEALANDMRGGEQRHSRLQQNENEQRQPDSLASLLSPQIRRYMCFQS